MGVTPILELWGFSKNLSRLGEVAFVAIESQQPSAAMLLDVYHLHKGGSGFSGLRLINGAALPLIHVNDYPAIPPRQQITDAHASTPATASHRLLKFIRLCATPAFADTCRWNCSTGITGSKVLQRSRKLAWRRRDNPCVSHLAAEKSFQNPSNLPRRVLRTRIRARTARRQGGLLYSFLTIHERKWLLRPEIEYQTSHPPTIISAAPGQGWWCATIRPPNPIERNPLALCTTGAHARHSDGFRTGGNGSSLASSVILLAVAHASIASRRRRRN